MLTIQNLSYIHPHKELLFSNINLNINDGQKAALIGNNGVGKSTLLKIIIGNIPYAEGRVHTDAKPYYIPQLFGQFNHLTVAEALGIDKKLLALHEILEGQYSNESYALLEDDWSIESRCEEALFQWGISDFSLSQNMGTLSGGQKTKIFLAGIGIHKPKLILLDEPSNHLDNVSRELLYRFIEDSKETMMVVSHDRTLLNLLDTMCELSPKGITTYGGNYNFYKEQREIELNALNQDIESKEKAFKKAKEKERESLERQQKLDARAKKNLGKAGLPKIVANTLKGAAERSTAKIKGVHAEKTANIRQELHDLRTSLSTIDQMKFGFDHSSLHKNKNLFLSRDINFRYNGSEEWLWKNNLNIQLLSGERVSIRGANGSGKTTLIQLILGNLVPQTGSIQRSEVKSVYIDQDYSIIDNQMSIYEQAQKFNAKALLEHEVKTRLNRFLFRKDDWEKPCHVLSGGERMRLVLCCLNIQNQSPDIIILDEPTNNLDIQNVEILTNAINDYQGSLLVISHDETFLNQIHVESAIEL